MKFKIVVLLAFCVLWITPKVQAQSNSGSLFLTLGPGNKATAMGWAYVAEASDVSAIYWNPAGLSFLDTTTSQVYFSYTNWIPLLKDIYHTYVAYEQYLKGWGHFAFALDFITYGKMERTLESGDPWYEFISNEFAFTPICYATQIAPNLSVGVGFKLIYSNLFPGDPITPSAKAFGYSTDIGILQKELFARYSKDGAFRSGLALGAVLSNIGPNMQYSGEDDVNQSLPQQLKVGVAYTLRQPIVGMDNIFNDILLMWDITKPLVNDDLFMVSLFSSWVDDTFLQELKSMEHSFGGEYLYASWLSIRGGYRLTFRQNARGWYLGDTATPTVGAGLLYPAGDVIYHIDLSYMPASGIIKNTTLLSLIVEF